MERRNGNNRQNTTACFEPGTGGNVWAVLVAAIQPHSIHFRLNEEKYCQKGSSILQCPKEEEASRKKRTLTKNLAAAYQLLYTILKSF